MNLYSYSKMRIQLLKIIFFLLCLNRLIIPKPQDYNFRQLGIEDGLSQSTVFASLQDRIGFMWFGTPSGLNKYDGYKFTVYVNDPTDSASIAGEVIVSLYEDRGGTLWVGSIEGNINKFNRKTDSFSSINISSLMNENLDTESDYYDYPLSFSRNHNTTITSIVEDDEGNIWLSTWGNGILVIDKNFKKVAHFYKNYSQSSSLTTNRITKLVRDADNSIWIATFGGGLSRCFKENDRYVFKDYSSSSSGTNSLSDNKLITLFIDSQQNLWIGTFYGGLNLLTRDQKSESPDKASFIRFESDKNSNSISNNTVMAICEDDNKHIWIGTFGSGLDRYNPDSKLFLNFTHNPINQNSLADNDVLSLSFERSGIIWAGSHLGAGLTKIQKSRAKFNILSHQPENPNSLSDNVVWSVYEDFNNILWVGTYRGGLNKIDRLNNQIKYFQYDSGKKNSLSSNHIRAINEDKFGNLWIGTYNKGLNILEKSSSIIKRINSNEKTAGTISSNQVQTILIDNDEYWIGTFGGGLNYLKTSVNPFNQNLKFNHYKNDPSDTTSISDNRVYTLLKDSKGNLWVGTFGGGLNKMDLNDGKFLRFNYNYLDNESLSDDKVLCILEDSDGFIWVGTFGGGLNKLDPVSGKFNRINQRQGLTSSVIYGILEDESKNLWLSTDNGIYNINYKSKNITRYDMLDGVQSNEFNGGSYFKSIRGELFFGGINGLNYFFPDSIKSTTFLPPVVITSISIQNELVKGVPEEILLDYNRNFISFEFASLDFNNPKQNSYSYILEGFDKNWQSTSSERRIANYTNLPPGSYNFKVKGSNSDGIWSNEEAKIAITIYPPIWQRWWFILFLVLSIGLIIYYISTLRIKNLLAIEKLKTKLAADLHDNIGSGLTEISILSELASFKDENKESDSKKELKIISDLSRQLIDNMSDIVWVVNPQRDSLHDLIIRLKNSYGETLNSLGISFRVSNLEKLKDIKLPLDFKQNLYLILKEAINNAIKHSKCSVITLDTNARKDFIEISITDDGIGIDENNILYGNGMKNIKQRAESIGGRVKWKSSPNQGTSLRFLGKRSGLSKIRALFNK